MLEVRSGVLLGSMGDALAAITRVASVTKVHSITHILIIANQPLDWSIVSHSVCDEQQNEPQEPEVSGEQHDQKTTPGGNGKKEAECEDGEGGEIMGGVESEGEGVRGVRGVEEVEVGGVRREARRGFQTMYVCLPDMAMSDLLHHFPACCQFIREAIDQKGTVLVHCEYGISRSVTVVSAYLMWSEGRPFKFLYDELKEKKPEISRLLFTEESVLQHELGRGQLAFKWHKRSKPTTAVSYDSASAMSSSTAEALGEQPASPKKDGEDTKGGSKDASKDETRPQASNVSDKVGEKIDSIPDHPPVPVTPTELAELRAHLATVVAMDSSSCSASPNCSSYFIEPVEWMETLLLGHVEGKILCPKCSARLGSFNWAGEQCSCGQWVVPSFQIHRSKIDETRTLTKRKPVVK